LKFQALVYPVTDATHALPSYEENGEGYLLTKDTMQWFIRHYIEEGQDKKHPYLSPFFEKDLSGLPPALVITAEFDPLRDEGVEYAKRLEEAGVPTRHTPYAGMIHGFFSLSSVFSDAAVALDEVAAALRGSFA
jgi:acetyl esterase